MTCRLLLWIVGGGPIPQQQKLDLRSALARRHAQRDFIFLSDINCVPVKAQR